MTNYGSMMEYDVTQTPIVMSVANEILEGVRKKFENDYRLPFTLSTSTIEDEGVFTFDESVDAETFLRHLKTASPEEYAAMAAEE